MKKNKWLLILGIGLSAAWLSSCGKALDRPYQWDQRTSVFKNGYEDGRAQGFAADLCVLSPEDTWEDERVNAEAAAVFDLSGKQVIFGKNAFEQLYPASITKVMTAIIAIKYGNLSDQVTVTDEAVITEAGASLCNVHPGDTLTLEQLLYGLMLPSGNDAAAAIAVHMAGSIEDFAQMMNDEAMRIGATGTHFVNPHGLTDPDHYTTAYDLYLMFNEALKLPLFREIISSTAYTAEYTDGQGNPVSQTWKGGNWYMTGERETPDGLTVLGGKTGTTSAAGYCLIMAVEDQAESEYISVVLKAGSRAGLYDNMTEIIQKISN